MTPVVLNKPPDRPLMTLRVSRDGGRSWSPVRKVWPDDCHASPLSLSDCWPPCACPRHRTGLESSR